MVSLEYNFHCRGAQPGKEPPTDESLKGYNEQLESMKALGLQKQEIQVSRAVCALEFLSLSHYKRASDYPVF